MTTAPTLSTRSAVPIIDVNPFDEAVLEDPGAFQAAVRDAGPVSWLSSHDVYVVGRHAEVRAALTDWPTFASAAGVGLSNFRREKPWRAPSLLLEADPPHHDAPRAVLTDILGPRELRRLRAAWFADAEQLVDQVLARAGQVIDLVPDLAQAFPLRVFPDAVGLPADGRQHLLPYGDHNFNAFGPENALVRRGQPRVPELTEWVTDRCRREVLTPDGFGQRIWAAADRGDITHEQAPLIVRSLLTAGVDTTVHGIGAVLHAFATHPAQWQRLRRDPSLARVAFDEAVRWESPVQIFFRTATTDTRIGEVTIGEGEKLLMLLGAANRDPRCWSDPDVFDLDRDPSGHVGFGMGLHQCIGQHVARLEAEALMAALAKRVERFEPAGPPRRHLNNTLRGWASMPVRVHLEKGTSR